MSLKQISTELLLYLILYSGAAATAFITSIYLLLRKGNAFADGITPPVQLRLEDKINDLSKDAAYHVSTYTFVGSAADRREWRNPLSPMTCEQEDFSTTLETAKRNEIYNETDIISNSTDNPLGFTASAQNDGFFNWNNNYYDADERLTGIDFSLPDAHGDINDHGAPLGSGLLILTALGAGYAIKCRNKNC